MRMKRITEEVSISAADYEFSCTDDTRWKDFWPEQGQCQEEEIGGSTAIDGSCFGICNLLSSPRNRL